MTSLIGKVLNKSPVSYGGRAIGGLTWAFRNNAARQMETMGSVSTVFAIVNRLSNATSQIDWHLYRKPTPSRRTPAPGEVPQRVEVFSHAALDLWNTPNPFMVQQEFVEASQQHIDLTGETTTVIFRDPRSPLPLELWPVRPDRMIPVPDRDQFLVGWIYSSPDGERVPLRRDEVIQIKMPNPLDPYRGLGPVQAALVDIDSARYGAEWNRNFFINSAEPGGHLEVETNLTDAEFEKLVKSWSEQHQGISNAHRVAVLEGGVKWKDRSFSPKDMQFSQLRGLSRELIREAFGIHGHMIGNSQDVNKANADAGEISFGKWLVYPRAQRWKSMLNARLLPMFEATDVEFDHDRVVPEDREADDRERTSKANAAAALATAKTWDPADILAAVGLPPMRELPEAPAPEAAPAPATE